MFVCLCGIVINAHVHTYSGSGTANLPGLTPKVAVIILGHKCVYMYCVPGDYAWLMFEV